MDKKAAHFPQGKAAATTAVLIYSQNRILCWIKTAETFYIAADASRMSDGAGKTSGHIDFVGHGDGEVIQ